MEHPELRSRLAEFLDSDSAHIDFDSAVDGFPVEKINTRIAGAPHTAWQLLEHIRIAQWDILEFCRDASHVSPDFPDGYWPAEEGTSASWNASVEQVRSDIAAMRELVSGTNSDLFARIPHGDGQTLFREALLVIDHNAYHLGQLMLMRRMLEST